MKKKGKVLKLEQGGKAKYEKLTREIKTGYRELGGGGKTSDS